MEKAYSADATSSRNSNPTTVEGVNVESDPSLILPVTGKTLYPAYPAEGDNIGSIGNAPDRYIVSAA